MKTTDSLLWVTNRCIKVCQLGIDKLTSISKQVVTSSKKQEKKIERKKTHAIKGN